MSAASKAKRHGTTGSLANHLRARAPLSKNPHDAVQTALMSLV